MRRVRGRTAVVVAALLALGLGSAVSAVAGGISEQVRQGIAAYTGKHFATAGKRFSSALAREPGSPTAALDLGTAQYRSGNYRRALSSFRRAATDRLASTRLQGLANYDQGKAFAKIGAHARNPSVAVGAYKKSAEAFHRALQIDHYFKNAAYNLEVVRRRIHRLEKKLPKRPSGRPSGKGHTGRGSGGASSSKNAQAKSPPKGKGSAGASGRRSRAGGQASAGSGASKRRRASSTRPENRGQGNARQSNGVAGSGSHGSSAGSFAIGKSPGGRPAGPRSGPRASTAANAAQRILNEESKHPRIMNIDRRQVSPHVSRNW